MTLRAMVCVEALFLPNSKVAPFCLRRELPAPGAKGGFRGYLVVFVWGVARNLTFDLT